MEDDSTHDVSLHELTNLPQVVLHYYVSEPTYPDGMLGHNHHTESDERWMLTPKIFSRTYNRDDKPYTMYDCRISYRDNPAIGCGWCCFPKSPILGYHEGDEENLILLADDGNSGDSGDSGDSDVRWVFFKAHARGQGLWKRWDECHVDGKGRLHVYVARGSHALYPYPDTWFRVFGLANDLCDDRGRSVLMDLSTSRVTGRTAYFPPHHSVTLAERFFLAFTSNKLKEKA